MKLLLEASPLDEKLQRGMKTGKLTETITVAELL